MASQLKMTKNDLLSLHRKYKQRESGFYDDTAEILNILGGIDNILTTYLESEHIPFTDGQIQQIYQILLKRKQIKADNAKNNENESDGPFYTYTFHENNSYLHSLFNEQTTSKILSILYHRITLGLFILTLITGYSLLYKFGGWISFIFHILRNCLFWIPWFILALLSCNKKAFKLLIHSFDFWIKAIYGVLYGVTHILFEYHLSDNGFAGVAYNVIFSFLVLLCIVFIALFDAFCMHRNWIVLFSIIGALFFTWNTMLYQFIYPEDHDWIIYIQGTNSTISMRFLLSSYTRILAIFLFKQAINAYRNKDKCISIHYTPFVEWNNSGKENEENIVDKRDTECDTVKELELNGHSISLIDASQNEEENEADIEIIYEYMMQDDY